MPSMFIGPAVPRTEQGPTFLRFSAGNAQYINRLRLFAVLAAQPTVLSTFTGIAVL
jgi:hypothetical protein